MFKLKSIFLIFILSLAAFKSAEAQTQNLFPYKIDFTPSETVLLKSLNKASLQKILDLAVNIFKYKNSQTQQFIQSIPATIPTTSSYVQPTPSQNSNFSQILGDLRPSHSNSLVRQSPQNNLSRLILLTQPRTESQVQPHSNENITSTGNPYLSQSAIEKYFPSEDQESNNIYLLTIESKEILKKIDEGTVQKEPSSSSQNNSKAFDISKIDPMCRKDYGIVARGSCPDIESLEQSVKNTAMEACTLIHKKIISQSQYRSKSCNTRVGGAGKSRHMKGMALDINVNNLTSQERKTVFLKFRQRGFLRVGCYRKGSGNIHLDNDTEESPMSWGPNYHHNTFNPKNCPPELIEIYKDVLSGKQIKGDDDNADDNSENQ